MSLTSKIRLSALLKDLPGLSAVEELVRAKFSSEVDALSTVPAYLFDLGGKRIRPLLSLLCSQALGSPQPSRELVQVSAGIELIHMATLLHDDIIDKSPMRRHQESPYVKFGTDTTLLAGDFLLVRAFSLCAHLSRAIIDATEQACVDLVEGEILEVPLHRATHNRESSLRIARKKTAALFRLATFSAAHISEESPDCVEAFAAFGEHLGTAFQILDDILDVTSSEEDLGKKSGLDLIERKPSIVNVLWLEGQSTLARRLSQPPGDPNSEEEFRLLALKELRSSEVISKVRALALGEIEQATQLLNAGLGSARQPFQPAVENLRGLLAFTVERAS